MDCPTCAESLDTEAGMRQHHAKVHGESLPNRTCKGCGTKFYDPKARLTYCDDCDPNAGEHNGNYKNAKETASCRRCDSTFEYYPSNKEGVYCSECVVSAEEFLGTPSFEIRDIERLTRTCDFCDEEMQVLHSERERGHGRFCSRECLNGWLSKVRRGPKHHQWEGGPTSYGGRWYQVRRAALERDNHECQHCGASAEELGQEPDVHHMVPVRSFDTPSEAHKIENVVTLCRSCHRHAEEGNITVGIPGRE